METIPFKIEDYNLSDFTNIQTISNLPVKIDKVFYNLTGTTPIGLSGIVVIRGLKLRGVWDIFGNPLELKKIFSLSIKYNSIDINNIFSEYDKDLLRLVKDVPIQSNSEIN